MGINEKEVNLMGRTVVVTGMAPAILLSLSCLAVLLWPSAVSPADAADMPAKHKFVGVKKCSMCHKSDAKGNQFKRWQESKHSHAYELLGTPEAKETAKKVGLKGDPQKSDDCLKCHVTAFGVAADMLEADFRKEDGVQCESCHGAGGDYKTLQVMKNKEQAIKNGLMMPTVETCKTCHNEKAPTFDPKKPYDFKAMMKKIAHPLPKAASAVDRK